MIKKNPIESFTCYAHCALHNPLPEQLPQYQQQQLQLPTPAANNQLALPQHQMQKEIRLMGSRDVLAEEPNPAAQL